MAITIQSTRENEIDNNKTVYFTINYKSTNYKWHGNVPMDDDAQEYMDAKSDTIKAEILHKLYREAVVPQDDYKTTLESFEAWVSAGHKNAEVKGEDVEGIEYVITPETVIEKATWINSH